MKQQFIVDTSGSFQTYIYENNRKAVPSAAVITVYKPGGTDKLVDNQAMTIGGDGLLSYNLTAVQNDAAAENYKAVVKYTLSGAEYYTTRFYDIVNSILTKTITDADLLAELPQLNDLGWRVHGTADSGSPTTIVDAELKRYEDDYFAGGIATNLTTNEEREITDFVASTGTVTTAAFATANDAGHKYMLQRSFSREIQRAFEKVADDLRRRGKRAHLVLDPDDLREVHIYRAVAEVCKGLMKDGTGSFWWELWKDYEKKAEDAMASIVLKYDASADGYITDSETNKRLKTIKVRF